VLLGTDRVDWLGSLREAGDDAVLDQRLERTLNTRDGDEVELEVWGEDDSGKRTTLGAATVQLGA